MSRRSLIKGLFILPLSFFTSPKAEAAVADPLKQDFTGELLTIGEGEHGFTSSGDQSLITRVKLKTDTIEQSVIPIKWGHLIASIDSNRLLAAGYKSKTLSIIDRKTFKHKKHLNLPKGYLSSGHFCTGERQLYINLYPDDEKYLHETGAIGVYDLKNLNLITVIKTPGYAPHDLELLEEGLLVTSVLAKKSKKGYSYYANQGYLAIVDVKHGKVLKSFNPQINATPTHLGVFDKDNIYVATNQFISINDRELLQKHLAKENSFFSPSNLEYNQKKIGVSSPILKFAANGNRIEQLEEHGDVQRRLLSFAINKKRKEVYVTCGHSNTLLTLNALSGKVKRSLSGFELGLSNIQGVYCLPTGVLGICDTDQGIILYDPTTDKVLRKFDVQLNMSTHLSWTL